MHVPFWQFVEQQSVPAEQVSPIVLQLLGVASAWHVPPLHVPEQQSVADEHVPLEGTHDAALHWPEVHRSVQQSVGCEHDVPCAPQRPIETLPDSPPSGTPTETGTPESGCKPPSGRAPTPESVPLPLSGAAFALGERLSQAQMPDARTTRSKIRRMSDLERRGCCV